MRYLFFVLCMIPGALKISVLTEEHVHKLMQFKFKRSEIECMAQNLYHEARGEGHQGMYAVAYVTMNRVRHGKYPKTICAVVFQQKQFSWTHQGARKPHRLNKDFVEAKRIAEDVFMRGSGGSDDPTQGAIFYHNSKVRPKWALKMSKTVKIGDHYFYKEG